MEGKLHFNVLFACVFEWNSEFVLPRGILDAKWNERGVSQILGLKLWHVRSDLFHADHLRDLNLAGQEDLEPLDLCDLFPVLEEVLHAAVKFVLQELFEALTHSEALVCVGQEADIYHGEHVLSVL